MRDQNIATLGELLCARLCHDLAGAVGAVGTGVELLVDDSSGGEFAADAVALLESSAQSAVRRLRFLRIALGSGGQALSGAQMRAMVSEFLETGVPGSPGAVRLVWRLDAMSTWSAAEVKLVLNLVLVSRDCLPRGGDIDVGPGSGGGQKLAIRAQGARATRSESAVALSASAIEGLNPRGAQGYYTSLLAQRLGLSVNCEDSHECVLFGVTENQRT
ncbi:MAG: hypothetical protein F8N37_08045 [Telmatospirillum sp.]|nr:hypothetical protein [Telmatospirillum sp.]